MVAKVLIENLAPHRTVSDLTVLLSPYEPIAWIFIELDSKTGRPWGYAYFALENQEQTKALVSMASERELDGGNDGLPIRLRQVESAPDNYIDKTPLLKSPAQYIFSQSRLVINDVPAGSSVMLDNVLKAELDISASIEMPDLIPGKYKLSVTNSQEIIFQQEIEILPFEAKEITIPSNKQGNNPLPFKNTLQTSESKSSLKAWAGLGLLITTVLCLSIYYFYFFNQKLSEPPQKNKIPSVPIGMAYIPGQRFVMGRNASNDSLAFDTPAHVVEIKQDFFLDKTEVTNKQYAEFVTSTKHPPPPHWKGSTPPQDVLDLPVIYVSWQDAFDYCQWRIHKERPCRLPREEEWELAARGPNGNVYPWGNEWRNGLANANNVSNKILPVGKSAANASPFGVLDMSGNVWEWVYDDLRIYELSKAPPQPGVKVIRGGAFDSTPEESAGSYRGFLKPNSHEYDRTGFRCVCDVVK